jgi:hypothetical protein
LSYVIAISGVLASIRMMGENRCSPERYEAMAKELRQIAKRLVHPENIAAITRQAEQLEVKAVQMPRAPKVRLPKSR